MNTTALRALTFGLFVSIASISSTTASAGVVWFETSFGPQYVLSNEEGLEPFETEHKNTSGLGFISQNTLAFNPWPWLMVGATANYGSIKVSREGTAPTDVFTSGFEAREISTSKFEFGPTLGFVLGNWRMSGTYILTGNKKEDSITTPTNGVDPIVEQTKTDHINWGYQLSLYYMFNISSKLKIGPKLVYRQVRYDKRTTESRQPTPGTQEQDYYVDQVDGSFEPMVTLGFQF